MIDFDKIVTPFMFQSKSALQIMDYAKEHYGDYVEFLWARFPKYAVLRRQDTQKWYAVLMVINGKKIDMPEKGDMEVINLHVRPQDGARLIADGLARPAYHMNKKHWVTVPLDTNILWDELQSLIDDSYHLAK